MTSIQESEFYEDDQYLLISIPFHETAHLLSISLTWTEKGYVSKIFINFLSARLFLKTPWSTLLLTKTLQIRCRSTSRLRKVLLPSPHLIQMDHDRLRRARRGLYFGDQKSIFIHDESADDENNPLLP